MIKRLFFSGLVATGLLAAVAGGGYSMGFLGFGRAAEEIVLKDHWALRWQALDVATRSQDLADDQWSAMIGINGSAMEALFEGIEGSELTYTADGLLKGATISLESVRISPALGALDASVALTARKGKLALGLTLEGSVLVTGIVNTEREVKTAEGVRFDPVSEISLRIEPTRIAPTVGTANLERAARRFWSDTFPGLASTILSDDLFTVRFDLPRQVTLGMGVDEIETLVIDQERNASATYRKQLPQSEIRTSLNYGAPIYTGDAVWLVAREVKDIIPDVVANQPPEGDAAQLEKEARNLDSALQGRLSSFVIGLGEEQNASAALVLDTAILQSLEQNINSLDDANRRLHIRLQSRIGRLAEDKWHDNILGEGGVYAEIGCPDCAELFAHLHTVDFETDGAEINFSANVEATAWVNVAAHIDPLIGGGAGTNVKIEGGSNGTQTISAILHPEIIESDSGQKIAVIGWQPGCERLDIAATTDGRIKFDFGWATAPRVGARMKLAAGPSMIEPVVVFEAMPNLLPYPAPAPLGETGSASNWAISYPNLASIVAIEPSTFEVKNNVLQVAAVFMVNHHEDITSTNEERKTALETLTEDVADKRKIAAEATQALLEEHQRASKCAADSTEVSVLIGAVEIGPNNEVVKFLTNGWNDIVNGPGPNNEIVKFLNDVGETFHIPDAVTAGLMPDPNPVPDITIKDNGGVKVETPGGSVETHGDHGGLGVTIETPFGGVKF